MLVHGGCLLLLGLLGQCLAGIPGNYLAHLLTEYENDILGRANTLGRAEEAVEEEEVVPGEVGHPVEMNSWDANLKLGQVAGVAVDQDDDPLVFHRCSVVWDGTSFNADQTLAKKVLITNNTILKIDQDNGMIKSGMGAGMFYMPHGITVDPDNNIWITDVGLHQVMKFPAGSDKPSLTLGVEFVPGNDKEHFCKPTAVAVSKSGIVYIADGYCNQRVVVYDNTGRYITEIKGDWAVVHSIVLFEDSDTICIADREGQKVSCVSAGLTHPQFRGKPVLEIKNTGRVFGLAGRGSALVATTGTPNPRGITMDLELEGTVVDEWGKGLVNPHQMAMSREGDTIYVSEIGPNRIRKFMVVAPEDNIFTQETY